MQRLLLPAAQEPFLPDSFLNLPHLKVPVVASACGQRQETHSLFDRERRLDRRQGRCALWRSNSGLGAGRLRVGVQNCKERKFFACVAFAVLARLKVNIGAQKSFFLLPVPTVSS
jgi:hypothetical protein